MKAQELPKMSAKVTLFEGKSKGRAELLGFAELTIAGAFVVRDIRLVKGKEDKPFVIFPRRGFGTGATRFYPVVSAVSEEAKEEARRVICRAFRQAGG